MKLSSTKKNSRFSRLQRGDLGDDLVDRPMPRGALEERLHRAEVAREVAAAAGLDQAERQVALAAEDRAVVAHLAEVGRLLER